MSGQCDPGAEAAQHADRSDWVVSGDKRRPSHRLQNDASLDLIHYSSEADLIQAAEQGDIYGGYVPGKSADTLVTVPAQSFFGEIYVRGAFTDAAKKSKRAITTKTGRSSTNV